MPRYDLIFARLAERAVAMGSINIESFMAMAVESGITEEALIEQLEHDLLNDGPLFGSFARSLSGAATSSVMAAVRQGELVGHAAQDAQLARLTRIAGVEGSVVDAINTADPAAAEMIEDAVAEDIQETWVAELINTCHRCLPLHGKTKSRAEWRRLNLLPESIHAGWESSCHCRLVPEGVVAGREDLVAPLVREKIGDQKVGKKRTRRAITQESMGKGLMARDRSLDTLEGRRMLRLMGQAQAQIEE